MIPKRRMLVEPPGTAPGSDPLITSAFMSIVPKDKVEYRRPSRGMQTKDQKIRVFFWRLGQVFLRAFCRSDMTSRPNVSVYCASSTSAASAASAFCASRASAIRVSWRKNPRPPVTLFRPRHQRLRNIM